MTPSQNIEFENQKRLQEQWRVIKSNQHIKKKAWFLLNNEYSEPEKRRTAHEARLKKYFNFITKAIPYYRHQLGDNFNDQRDMFEYLRACPILTKSLLQEHFKNLVAKVLPKGHKVVGRSSSSGTTGKPSHVLTTQWHRLTFSLLKQREYRWFGMNPKATLGMIRLPVQLSPRGARVLGLGETIRGPWPSVGPLFYTGQYFGFSVLNSIQHQKEWLKKKDPSYLTAYAESLEHLAFHYGKGTHSSKLKGLQSTSETLSSDMKERIRGVFPVPIHQNYGLNELGLVATRSLEGGRYHVLVKCWDGIAA